MCGALLDEIITHNTFFPIPLVGDGAGDTGTKSIRFGDDDVDFSKSLSLWNNIVYTFSSYHDQH